MCDLGDPDSEDPMIRKGQETTPFFKEILEELTNFISVGFFEFDSQGPYSLKNTKKQLFNCYKPDKKVNN